MPAPASRRHLIRLALAVTIVAAVYAFGVVGNAFWGYGAGNDAQGATSCSTDTAGVRTCVTKTCISPVPVGRICSTETTTCSAPNTSGGRYCHTTSVENRCYTDLTDCQPSNGGSFGDCTTSTTGVDTCRKRECHLTTPTTGSSAYTVCTLTTTTCTAPTTTGQRTCTQRTEIVGCVTALGECGPPTTAGPSPGSGGGSSSGGGGGGGGSSAAVKVETASSSPADPSPTTPATPTGTGSTPAPRPATGPTLAITGIGTLVLDGTTIRASPAGARTGVVAIGTATCDSAGIQTTCRFRLSGTAASTQRGAAQHPLTPRSATLRPAGQARVSIALAPKERAALRARHTVRVTLTVSASADGRSAKAVRRTLVIAPPAKG
jgi:uncharacterized membrane protein YgcG